MIWNQFKDKPASAFTSMTFATEVICPRCGCDIELWGYHIETTCDLCGYHIFEHEKTVN
jgi:DNA-directed RNA polymerase subunit RPC12/RpoP